MMEWGSCLLQVMRPHNGAWGESLGCGVWRTQCSSAKVALDHVDKDVPRMYDLDPDPG